MRVVTVNGLEDPEQDQAPVQVQEVPKVTFVQTSFLLKSAIECFIQIPQFFISAYQLLVEEFFVFGTGKTWLC